MNETNDCSNSCLDPQRKLKNKRSVICDKRREDTGYRWPLLTMSDHIIIGLTPVKRLKNIWSTLRFILFFVHVLLACMQIHVHDWYLQRPEEGVIFFEPELRVVVSYHVNTRNLTPVLWKSSKCFHSWVISPAPFFLNNFTWGDFLSYVTDQRREMRAKTPMCIKEIVQKYFCIKIPNIDNLAQILLGSRKTRKPSETYFYTYYRSRQYSSFWWIPSLVSREWTVFHFLLCLTLSLTQSRLVSHWVGQWSWDSIYPLEKRDHQPASDENGS